MQKRLFLIVRKLCSFKIVFFLFSSSNPSNLIHFPDRFSSFLVQAIWYAATVVYPIKATTYFSICVYYWSKHSNYKNTKIPTKYSAVQKIYVPGFSLTAKLLLSLIYDWTVSLNASLVQFYFSLVSRLLCCFNCKLALSSLHAWVQ